MEDIKTLLDKYQKNILEHFDAKTEEVKRHMDILREDYDDKTKLLAEAVSGVQEQLYALQEATRKNAEAIASLQDQVVAIREMVAQNTKDITIIKMDIQFIKQELKHKVDRDEFEALEKRVAHLENARTR